MNRDRKTGQVERSEAHASSLTLGFLGAAVVVLAVLARLPDAERWPLEFHTTRQYHGAITARKIWMALQPARFGPDQRAWAREVPPLIEPPLLEALTVATYLPDGRERPWTSEVFASLAWLAGGWFVFDLGRRLAAGAAGGWAAAAYYLLAPFGMYLSQSFQPEALLTLGFVGALWHLVRADVGGLGWRANLQAGLVCGLGALVKPGVLLLPLLGAYVGLVLGTRQVRDLLRAPPAYAFAALTALPSVAYALIFLRSQMAEKSLYGLVWTGSFYTNWWSRLEYVVDWRFLMIALAGACLLALRPGFRFLGWGLLAGYVGYAFSFPWHNMTHTYYTAPLLPIVALLLAPVAEALAQGVRWERLPGPERGAGVVVVAVALILFALPGIYQLLFRRADPARARLYETIGRTVGVGRQVLTVSEAYGFPLMFHGWLVTHPWPTEVDQVYEQLRTGRPLTPAARFEEMVRRWRPSHFVVTDAAELSRRPELAKILERYPVCFQASGAVVYDLGRPGTASGAALRGDRPSHASRREQPAGSSRPPRLF